MAQQAQETFIAVLGDGTERFVAKGEPFADGHELVLRDQDASRVNPSRTPLFRPLDFGEEEVKAPAAKPRPGLLRGTRAPGAGIAPPAATDGGS